MQPPLFLKYWNYFPNMIRYIHIYIINIKTVLFQKYLNLFLRYLYTYQFFFLIYMLIFFSLNYPSMASVYLNSYTLFFTFSIRTKAVCEAIQYVLLIYHLNNC